MKKETLKINDFVKIDQRKFSNLKEGLVFRISNIKNNLFYLTLKNEERATGFTRKELIKI